MSGSTHTTSFAVCAFGIAPNSVFNQVLNYEKRVVSCNLDTLKKNGVAVGLDAASLGADAFGPEEQYAKLAIGLTLSTGAMINSAANHDMTGTGLGMASYLRAAGGPVKNHEE
jgi:hypothetical protein